MLMLFRIDMAAAAAASAVHTAATDVLGHSGLWRNRYHDLVSMAAAAALAAYLHNPVYIALGVLHVLLDWISPGRLAVDWLYNAAWSLPPALIIMHMH